jgi:16S rRNA processing protein RimM
MTTAHQDLVEIGTVIEAYGIRGALKIRPFSNDPVALLAAKQVWFVNAKNPQFNREYDVYSVRMHSGSVLLELVGLTDRDIALNLKSSVVAIPRSQFPTPDTDEYYWTDLMDVQIYNLAQEHIGKVVEIVDNSAQTVLIIEDDDKKQHLIPFVESFIIEVHLESDPKRIVVDWQKDW